MVVLRRLLSLTLHPSQAQFARSVLTRWTNGRQRINDGSLKSVIARVGDTCCKWRTETSRRFVRDENFTVVRYLPRITSNKDELISQTNNVRRTFSRQPRVNYGDQERISCQPSYHLLIFKRRCTVNISENPCPTIFVCSKHSYWTENIRKGRTIHIKQPVRYRPSKIAVQEAYVGQAVHQKCYCLTTLKFPFIR